MKSKKGLSLQSAITVVLILFHFSSFTQVPTWLDSDQRKALYPDAEYFTGFGEASLTKGELMEDNMKAARSYAKQSLAESVQVIIESITVHNVSERNQEVQESYKQAVSSISSINLPGIKEETPYYDKKKKTTYAFAWVSKWRLAEYYQEQLDIMTSKLEGKLQKAKYLSTANLKQQALESYQECFPLLRQMEVAVAMLVTIGIDPVGKLPYAYETEVNENISSISRNANLTLDEMCQLLAGSILVQLAENDKTIRLIPYAFEDTRITSELSARFGVLFESELTKEGLNVSTMGIEGIQNPLLLTGSYWDDGNYLKFIASIKELSTGKTIASTQNRVPKTRLIESGISWKPENFEETMTRRKIFTEEEIIGRGLILDVWTNKGDENLLYVEGEIMTIHVKVNHACWLRFIYYLADGRKTQLIEDYYVDSDKVNQLIPMLDSGKCGPPFGVETFQVIAQTEKFLPLDIEKIGPYYVILNDTRETVRIVRGMARNNNHLLFGEKRLVITTIPK